MKPVDLTSAAIDDGTALDGPRGIVRRECHCPPQVVRCIHLGDLRALIADNSYVIPGCDCAAGQPCPGFLVGIVEGPARLCPRGCGNVGADASQTVSYKHCDSEADALAAFHEAAKELLETARALA